MEIIDNQAGELLHLLMEMGEKLFNAGAEVNRIEDTIYRMGIAYGAVNMNVFVITSSIVVTMQMPSGKEITQTRRIINTGSTDFTELERLNNLSRHCSAGEVSLEQLREQLEAETPANKPIITYIGSAIVGFSFAIFFGGTLPDGLVAAIFGLLICFLQRNLKRVSPTPVMFNIVCSFLVGIGICLCVKLFPTLNMDKIIIGDIMLLIPGIAMTNAIRDILMGDTVSGTMRLVESTLWAGSLAGGLMSAIWLIGG